jgi:hypothetical protein
LIAADWICEHATAPETREVLARLTDWLRRISFSEVFWMVYWCALCWHGSPIFAEETIILAAFREEMAGIVAPVEFKVYGLQQARTIVRRRAPVWADKAAAILKGVAP